MKGRDWGLRVLSVTALTAFLFNSACWGETQPEQAVQTQVLAGSDELTASSNPVESFIEPTETAEVEPSQTALRAEPTQTVEPTSPQQTTAPSDPGATREAPRQPTPVTALVNQQMPPAPQLIQSGREAPDLVEKVTAYFRSRGVQANQYALVYHELGPNPVVFQHRPHARFLSASTIKVAAAMACAKLAHQGLLSLDDEIPAIPDGVQYIYDEGDLARFGQTTTFKTLIVPMLRESNNTAASILFHEFLKRRGVWLHHLMDRGTGTNYSPDTTLSAAEGANLMLQLVQNPEGIEAYPWIFDQLKHSTWNAFLTRDIPQSQAANKYGQIGQYNHEIGWVGTAKPYIYSVYTEGVSPDVLAGLGKCLYDWNTAQ